MSEGAHASLNLGLGSGDRADAVRANRQRVVDALELVRFVAPRQVHGARVHRVQADGAGVGDADALVTDAAGVGVAVLGADCPLILVVDPRRRALGVVHSGWRGTLAGVVPATIDGMRRYFGTNPRDLRVGVGPSISASNYEVGPEVYEAFTTADPTAEGAFARDEQGRLTLDVAQVILAQLERLDVPPENVDRVAGCTYADEADWFSHRRDGPATGRHAILAGWHA